MSKRKIQRYAPGYELYGIENGHGAFWTHEVFKTREEARKHMEQYWGSAEKIPANHSIIPVRIKIEDARELTD